MSDDITLDLTCDDHTAPMMTDEKAIEAVQAFIGADYSSEIRDTLEQTTGRQVVGPNDATTLNIDPSRIHLMTDAQGKITGIQFG